MKIINVKKSSLASRLGIKAGDELTSINGKRIDDILDFRFYSADEYLIFKIIRNGKTKEYLIEKEYDEELGIVFEQMKFKRCGNKCIFCFIDQNPPEMRKQIYFKDEDYRLSFLYGNYITLTNIKQKEIKKIIDLKLSPLYISVHAIDTDVRKRLLGIKRDDEILKKIKYLTDNSIRLHGQIVLCPGINDGNVLKKTVFTLFQFYPNFESVAVVPVGLTKYREKLEKIKQVDRTIAEDTLRQVKDWQKTFKKKSGSNFVFLSDEFYILSGRNFPKYEEYEDFKQIENGVGLSRYFINELSKFRRKLPKKINKKVNLGIITGKQAEGIIKKHLVPVFNRYDNIMIEMFPVINSFYGESVKVSGLLAGKDIYEVIKNEKDIDLFLLPPNCLNLDDYFIDDMSFKTLQESLNSKIMLFDEEKLINYFKGIK